MTDQSIQAIMKGPDKTMSGAQFNALQHVIAYLFSNEQKDYEANPTPHHIFQSVRKLRDFAKNANLEAVGLPPEDIDDEICPRCGVGMQATHHPLCEYSDGTPTTLSDEAVRDAIRILGDTKISDPVNGVVQWPGVSDGKAHDEIVRRWAKESIGRAALDLQRAYKEFLITDGGWEYPTGQIEAAYKRLEEVREIMTPDLTDDIPW